MLHIYEYECAKCGKAIERMSEMDKRAKRIRCDCGGWAKRVICAPAIKDDALTPYMRHLIGSPNDPGCIVDNKLAATKKIPVPETRSQFEQYCRENKINVVKTI